MSEAKSEENSGTEEQSMEEILQSIRRIITEDDADGEESGDKVSEDTSAEAAPAEESQEAEEIDIDALMAEADEPEEAVQEEAVQEEAVQEEKAPEEESPVEETAAIESVEEALEEDSDILELTEIVEVSEEEATVEDDIDALLSDEEEKEPEPEPEPVEEKESSDEQESDGLISKATAEATSALFNEIKNDDAVPMAQFPKNFRNATTVEDLVVEAMKPMLKQWLDDNLPQLVERVIQAEVRKLSSGE